ncbi:hypothetical protein brsh051_15310 [Brooklawnia propionicigenes]|jgi:glutaminase|uniref:glutaminase n=1 Tax=Brooklawnia propionicigenes TaxID=3041175 RepID=A0AAN0KI81_9ACTN|nr:hypothetical protein brsh051_15310 [Brooklawnia sp. SH051]
MAFNSLAAVERSTDGRTNPMVNPGAIATTILLPGTDEQKWQCLADGLSRFAGHELDVDQEVYVRVGDESGQPGRGPVARRPRLAGL